MKTYPISMTPGPVKVPAVVLEAYQCNYGSADLETEYLELYNHTEAQLQTLLKTKNKIAIQTGEGMLSLWGALKSCLFPGDRVLCVATGLFGYGIGEMAAQIGAEVKTFGLRYDQTISELSEIEKAIRTFKPKMITAVHCETPSGTLNPLEGLGRLKKEYDVPLFYVDAVASLGGALVDTDRWNIDLLLGGSQKCLSVPPAMAFVGISEKAWQIIDAVNYPGYDALKPFASAQKDFYFPYTPYWHGLSTLSAGAGLILEEGLEACFERHAGVASYCRQRLVEIGYQLYPAEDAVPSPTVTAVFVPEKITWHDLDRKFRDRGLVVGGNYGPLSGKVFRLGHMGSQADRTLMDKALEVLEKVFNEI